MNCKNCLAKKSIITISTPEYYPVKRSSRYGNYEYRTRSDKTAFHICKNCGHHDDFANVFTSNVGVFWAYFVPSEDYDRLKNLQGKKKPHCLYCDAHQKPPFPQINEVTQKAVTLLYIKSAKDLLGYFCSVCRVAYYLKNDFVNWKDSRFFEQKKRVDLLNPLTGQMPENIRIKHSKYNPVNKLIQDTRYLDCIGNFMTTKGVDFGPINPNVFIEIPKGKYKRIIDYLQRHGCKLVR